MRVVECNVCGAAISAESDVELSSRLSEHLEGEHGHEVDEEAVAATVEEEAYEATDS